MSIAEVACFHIESDLLSSKEKPFLSEAPRDSPTATLRAQIAHGLRVLGKMSKSTFHLLQDIEDPSYFYYVGKWRSKEAYVEFSKSADRDEVVGSLQDCKAVMDWRSLYKIESLRDWETSIVSHLLHKTQPLLSGKVIGIGRNNVAPEDMDKFHETLSKSRVEMERYSGYKNVIAQEIPIDVGDGWSSSESTSQQKEDVRIEFVMLSGWASVEQYRDFRSSDRYMEFAQVREWTKWFDRKVAKLIPLE